MKHLGAAEPYPNESDAKCVTFTRSDEHGSCSIVVVHERFDRTYRTDPAAVVALIVHEATHVWQQVRRAMNDSDQPSSEFEAYAMQAIVQGLYQAYLDTRISRR